MAEFGHGAVAKFFHFLGRFQLYQRDINANERWQKKSLPTWEAKTKTKTPPRVQKFFQSGRCSVTKRGRWKIFLVMSFMQFFPGFFRWNQRKGRSRIRTRGCHAVLVGPSSKSCSRNYSILRDREFPNSRQQLEASAGLRKAKKMPLVL